MKQILILLTLLFSFTNVSGQEKVDVFNAINSVNKKLVNCINKGDIECAVMYYTENAVFIGPNIMPLVGRDEIKAGMVVDGTTLLTLQTNEIGLILYWTLRFHFLSHHFVKCTLLDLIRKEKCKVKLIFD